jgi:hypothetical protein
MSELNLESTEAHVESPQRWGSAAVIVAIIAAAVVTLACIVACTVVAYAFLINAPW